MADIDAKIRPIIIFGYILLGLAVMSVLFLYWVPLQPGEPLLHLYFGLFIAGWFFVTGLGVIKLTKWGYYLFKILLYLLFVSFPIGTFISYKTLSYMKKNNIKNRFFQKINMEGLQ